MKPTEAQINQRDQQVSCILREFDFDKVQRVMQALDWSWFSRGNTASPNVDMLYSTAERLLVDVYAIAWRSANTSFIETGGFRAEATVVSEVDEILLELSFVVEHKQA